MSAPCFMVLQSIGPCHCSGVLPWLRHMLDMHVEVMQLTRML